MKRLYPLILAAALTASCRTAPASVHPLPVHREPLHQFVHEGTSFKVLDVQIPAGAVSRWHVHDAPITYVSIDASPMDVQNLGGEWRGTLPTADPPWQPGEFAWTLDYAHEPLTHRVTNVGLDPFRVIAIINEGIGKSQAGNSQEGALGASALERECPWFRVSRLSLEPNQTAVLANSVQPTVLVLVSEGSVRAVTPADTWEGSEPGAFLVRETSGRCELRNLGAHPAELVSVEVQ